MIDPIVTYLAVCHTNLDDIERIEAGIFIGWKLQLRGNVFCSSYQTYGRYIDVDNNDRAMAVSFGEQIAEKLGLPFVNNLSTLNDNSPT